ncbi:M23/M56 family metallopeptidase [Alkalimonas amylolytica]|uniref:BlaR1 peptidase M56 n=1 Tax=Alkalimonas amylolytica TaxID=152573 RepID=A0A1H3XP20_ALKAM|nr:M23/M56 family metallopeptidase [Alkalimonas amylolytica]SEA01096.1 BlaR1 peptidase M56 [Alkalimonas amylolytica]
MAQQLLISLLLCSLWTVLLWQASQFLLKKYSALQQWPPFFWCLLGLCFLPLLPLPELGQQWTIPSVLLQDTLHSIQTETAQPQHPGLIQPPANSQSLWWWLLGCVFSISLWQLCRIARQWQRLQQLIRHAEPLPATRLFSPAQLALLPPQLEIRQTEAAISPFIAGWSRMVLVVPAYIWQFTAQQRQLLLEHELAHLQRRDPQQLLLLRILVAVCWFNPLLRQIEQAFIRSMELAVDQAVLARQPDLALLYGQTLLSSLKLSQATPQPALTAALIHTNTGHSFYQQRLQQLFQPCSTLSSWQRWRIPLAVGGAAMLLNLGGAQLSYSAPPEDWLLPVGQVPITSAYATQHPLRQNRPHQGVDFGAAQGSDITAAQKGKVLIADATSLHSRYGKVVLIDHGHGYQTLYAHLDDFYVTAGQSVAAGEAIGTVGATGRVTGPHLHFELLRNGQHQDPARYLTLP